MKASLFFSLTVVLVCAVEVSNAHLSCKRFLKTHAAAKILVSSRKTVHKVLDSNGIKLTEKDIEFVRSQLPCNQMGLVAKDEADAFTLAAKLEAEKNIADLKNFAKESAIALNRTIAPVTLVQYRSFSGVDNNWKKPWLGSAGTPFGRFGPKTYSDGVHAVRKVFQSSQDLPSPRKIMEDILKMAEKKPRPTNKPNSLLNAFIFYFPHDMGHQAPVDQVNGGASTRCCTSGNEKVLSVDLSNAACLPIEIPADDVFYSIPKVGCMNMVRSKISSSPVDTQFGEPNNFASAFVDHSMIYGNDDEEALKLMSSSQGKLNLNSAGIPVDVDGNSTKTTKRLSVVITGSIWPVIFAKNHNRLAEALANLNPNWTNRKVYDEARRLNIAVYQSLIYSNEFTNAIFGSHTKQPYSDNIDPSTTVEFQAVLTRFFHYFVQSNMRMVDSAGVLTNVAISDTLMRTNLLINSFDNIVRGMLSQSMNFGQYSGEMTNKFVKNAAGVGLDIMSLDIQRGRDQGAPTFIEMRRKCGLNANFTTFEDLLAIFPQSYIDLLKNVYANIEDIDLLVGGSLESFQIFDKKLVGETFSCIFQEQFRRSSAGDAYFYSRMIGPSVFSAKQLASIAQVSFSHLICLNTQLDSVPTKWFLVQDAATNPEIPCSNFNSMDLSSWVAA